MFTGRTHPCPREGLAHGYGPSAVRPLEDSAPPLGQAGVRTVRGEGHCHKAEKAQEDRQAGKEGEGRDAEVWPEAEQGETKMPCLGIDIS